MADIGILFVHGIGQQKRAATLANWGGALVDWLTRYLSPEWQVSPSDLLLNDTSVMPESPYSKQVTIASTQGGEYATEWLFAESWWAESFETPTFAEVAKWGAGVLPWSFFAAFNDASHRAVRSGSRKGLPGYLLGVLTYGALLPLVLLVQTVVLALIPLAFLRRLLPWVVKIQSLLARSVGDTQVLLMSQSQFDSMISRVRSDLHWLSERCAAVVIVAHSQGTALVHEVINTEDDERVLSKIRHLVTFGQAISRLHVFRLLGSRVSSLYAAASVLAVSLVALGAMYTTRFIGFLPTGPAVFRSVYAVPFLVFGMYFLALAALVTPVGMRASAGITTKGLLLRQPSKRFRWLDLYASSDPVPNGPFVETMPDEKVPGHILPESEMVMNTATPIWDHTTYWRNTDGFVSRVAKIVVDLATIERSGGPGLSPQSSILDEVAKLRQRRFIYAKSLRLTSLAWGLVVFDSFSSLSELRVRLFVWGILIVLVQFATFWLGARWGRAEVDSFLSAGRAISKPLFGILAVAVSLVAPIVVTMLTRPAGLDFTLVTAIGGYLPVLVIGIVVASLTPQERRYIGPFVAPDGSLRLGSFSAAAFSAGASSVACVIYAAGTRAPLSLKAQALLPILLALMLLPAALLGFISGSSTTKLLAFLGFIGLLPSLLQVHHPLLRIILVIVIFGGSLYGAVLLDRSVKELRVAASGP